MTMFDFEFSAFVVVRASSIEEAQTLADDLCRAASNEAPDKRSTGSYVALDDGEPEIEEVV